MSLCWHCSVISWRWVFVVASCWSKVQSLCYWVASSSWSCTSSFQRSSILLVYLVMVDGWWLMVDGWWLMVDGWWCSWLGGCHSCLASFLTDSCKATVVWWGGLWSQGLALGLTCCAGYISTGMPGNSGDWCIILHLFGQCLPFCDQGKAWCSGMCLYLYIIYVYICTIAGR